MPVVKREKKAETRAYVQRYSRKLVDRCFCHRRIISLFYIVVTQFPSRSSIFFSTSDMAVFLLRYFERRSQTKYKSLNWPLNQMSVSGLIKIQCDRCQCFLQMHFPVLFQPQIVFVRLFHVVSCTYWRDFVCVY